MGGGGGGGWCLNVNLVIGFGPNLGLAFWPRAKPINTFNRGGLGLKVKLRMNYNIKSSQAEHF